MRNKIIKTTALTIFIAALSSISYAQSSSVADEGCNNAKSVVAQQLEKAHSANQFLDIKISQKVLQDKCMASLIYEVEDEREMNELHLKFVSYLNANTNLGVSNARQYTKN